MVRIVLGLNWPKGTEAHERLYPSEAEGAGGREVFQAGQGYPKNGTSLVTMHRRMSKRDVGSAEWCGLGAPADGPGAYLEELESSQDVQTGSLSDAASEQHSLGAVQSPNKLSHLLSLH